MLYLFNSGFRPLYVTNVLNTLALPTGYNNEYRYKHSGESRQISPTLYSDLGSLQQGEECVLIFIDRFGEKGYVYYPLRHAKFVTYRDVNEYVHFKVRLDSFIYPRNLGRFNKDLVQALAEKGLPVLTNAEPKNTRDGHYVIKSPSIFGNADEYQKGDPAWNSAIEDLSRVPALETSEKQAPLFYRVEIHDRKKQKPVAPTSRDFDAYYTLNKNTPYDLVLTYRYPRQRIDQTAKGHLEINFGEALKGESGITIDTHANSLPIPFSTKRYVEEVRGAVSISPVAESGPELLVSDRALQYELAETGGFWVQVTIALLLFSVIGALIGVDFTRLQPFTLRTLLSVAWLKVLFGFVQTCILFWLFRLIGKKLF